jgi:hypothetical protein
VLGATDELDPRRPLWQQAELGFDPVLAAPPNTTDWITAIGSAFAAVGTVGAVIVALWQTRRRDKYKVHVVCNWGITGDSAIGNLLSLQATNTGERLVKLTMAYLLTDGGSQVVAKFFQPSLTKMNIITSIEQSPLPESLVDGESVTVYWQLSILETIKVEQGFDHYVAAFFTDPLGTMYAAPYPRVKVKRKGWPWRRRTEYVPASVS